MVLLIVPIAILLTAYVALATSRQSTAWADALIRWVANFPVVGLAVAKVLGPLLVNGSQWIANRLGRVYLSLESRAINWVGALAHYVRMVSDATIEWPIEMLTLARWLVNTEIPRLVHALPNSVTRLIHSALAQVLSLERAASGLVAGLPKRIGKLVLAVVLGFIGPYLAAIRYFASVYHKIAHAAAVAGGIAEPWIWTPRLRRTERKLTGQITKLWPLLGVAGAVGLLARAFRLSKTCVADGNLGRAARQWCASDSSLIESLLGDLIAIASVISVVEFAKELQAIEGDAVKILAAGIREFPS